MTHLKSCDTPEDYISAIARNFPHPDQLHTSYIDISFLDVGRRGDHRYEFSASFYAVGKLFVCYKAYQSTGEETLTSDEQMESVDRYVGSLEKAFHKRYGELSFVFDPHSHRINFNQ